MRRKVEREEGRQPGVESIYAGPFSYASIWREKGRLSGRVGKKLTRRVIRHVKEKKN